MHNLSAYAECISAHMLNALAHMCCIQSSDECILGVVSKQLRLLHGRVGDSTTSVNSLSPQITELVEDAVLGM